MATPIIITPPPPPPPPTKPQRVADDGKTKSKPDKGKKK